VPSYLGFKDRANQKAAAANVRSAIPSAEAFYSDNSTYVGLTPSSMALIDSGVKVTTVTGADIDSYTLCSEVGNKAASYAGPGGNIVEEADGAC
jgi:hypothetical protein